MREGRKGIFFLRVLCAPSRPLRGKSLSAARRPRAMMPRSTSRVPPWIVNLGAIRVVWRSASSKRSSLLSGAESPVGGANRRTLLGSACSKLVPRSLTTAASTAGVLPACSMPATESDMRRKVARCATSRPMPSAKRSLGSFAGAAHQLDQHREGFHPAVRAAALIGEFVGRLLPGHVDLADQVQVGHEHVVEDDLVEIVLRRSG